MPIDAGDTLPFAEVLVELGWLHDAEIEVADALDADPHDRRALSLYAKIKHIRGELSQAIACWAHLHLHSAWVARARAQLEALLHLAEDPERGAAEYLAVGESQLARKPSGQLALEQAFTLVHARRPREARARCLDIAKRYRAADPQTYKLAVLANAWIAELSGDLEGARDVLESLARERGFETDTDRLLALAGIYERLGSPERLRAAVRILCHLEQDVERPTPPWLLSRLASLYARLGDSADAETWARRFLIEFRRSMHRPSFGQTLRVAARRYLPLERLRAIRFFEADTDGNVSPRARGLAAALHDELDEALELFASGGEPLDDKYAADIASISGDRQQAADAYLRTLAVDPDDLLVVGQVLRLQAREPMKAIAVHFGKMGVFERTRDMLEAAIRRAPLRPSLWRELATLHGMHGDDTAAAQCSQRAVALEDAARDRSLPIGRVLSVGIYHFIGKARGLVHEVWVDREPVESGRGGTLPADQILGNLTPELKEGVRNTFLSVREYARTKFPHQTGDILDYRYSFKLPKEDEPSGGLSAGVPSALAFLSVFLQRPVRQDLAMTGMLVADAHDVLTVRAVGDIELKIAAAYHRNLRGIILPRENLPGLAAGLLVPQAIRDEMVHYAASFDDAVRLVWGTDVFVAR